MNKILLDPISKLLHMDNPKQLNNLESKREFLKDFKFFLNNSDEKNLLIDRLRLKKLKNDIIDKHQSIFEENKTASLAIKKAKNIEYLNINNAYKVTNEKNNFINKNFISKYNLKTSAVTSPNCFVVCNKNSKNTKNLKLFDEINKAETKNKFFEAISIINTKSYLNTVTKANTTKSIGVDTNFDFHNLEEVNAKNNKIYPNSKINEEAALKQTIQEIFKTEKFKQEKIQKNNFRENEKFSKELLNTKQNEKRNNNYNYVSNSKRRNKQLNCDIENILTNESIVEYIRNQKDTALEKIKQTKERQFSRSNFVKKNLEKEYNKTFEEDLLRENKNITPKYLHRKKNSPTQANNRQIINNTYSNYETEFDLKNKNNKYNNKIFSDEKSSNKLTSKKIELVLTER